MVENLQLRITIKQRRGISHGIGDFSLSTKLATIGSSADQSIQLPDASLPRRHSTLGIHRGKLQIATVDGSKVSVAGKKVKKSYLSKGDTVSFNGFEILVLEHSSNNTVHLEILVPSESISSIHHRSSQSIREIDLPIRLNSWVLFVSVLAICLVLPGIGLSLDIHNWRTIPNIPDDSIWSTGTLHQSHAFIGDDCSECHKEVFKKVGSSECLGCHSDIKSHLDRSSLDDILVEGITCTSCHKEHSPTDSIIPTDQKSCSICHADLKAVGIQSPKLKPAEDFAFNHPPFGAAIQEGVQRANDFQHIDLHRSGKLYEASNLMFPHDVHLNKEGINAPDGIEILTCDDCHKPDSIGNSMLPITMEEHCEQCHELTFDPDNPERLLPHGPPSRLLKTLQEYYALKLLQNNNDLRGTLVLETPNSRAGYRPGKSAEQMSIVRKLAEDENLSPSEKDKSLEQQLNSYSLVTARRLIEETSCLTCHEVIKNDAEDEAWAITPPVINRKWMPLATFSHRPHRGTQCTACHEADSSKVSTDVLMPGIEKCQECHGSEATKNKLQSTCVTCHKFHLDKTPFMSDLVRVNLNKDSQKK